MVLSFLFRNFQRPDWSQRDHQDQRLRHQQDLGRWAVHLHELRRNRGLDGAGSRQERALQRKGSEKDKLVWNKSDVSVVYNLATLQLNNSAIEQLYSITILWFSNFSKVVYFRYLIWVLYLPYAFCIAKCFSILSCQIEILPKVWPIKFLRTRLSLLIFPWPIFIDSKQLF